MTTHEITVDQLLSPLANFYLNCRQLNVSEEDKVKTTYTLKAYASNFATALIVAAVACAIFMNATSALVYGAIGYGVRSIVEQNLREIEGEDNKMQNVFARLHLKPDPNWSPDWVIFCGHTILRHGLPSKAESV